LSIIDKVFLRELGIKLKQQRKQLGLKQSELVEKINNGLSKNDDDYLSDKQMSRVECGKSATRLDKFVKWSLALGKTPDYFLLGIDYIIVKTEKYFKFAVVLKIVLMTI